MRVDDRARPAGDGPLAGAAATPEHPVAVRKTTTRLSDGRKLIYFDEAEEPARAAPDRRALYPAQVTSELRRDPLTGEWVIIASHRQGRTHLPPNEACPLCPTSPGHLTEIPAGDYDVVVFENRFPALTAGNFDGLATDGPAPLLERRPSQGRCEVVCFSADHHASFADLPAARARLIVEAWVDRNRELAALPGVRQVFPFENRGREIGVTLSHPHGQIYAYPFVTPRTQRMLETARNHHLHTGRNLFADVLRAEQHTGERVIRRSEHWTAFVPAAARWPVEVHLFPNRHTRELADLTPAERDDFAAVYLDLLKRLDRLYGVPMPYMAGWYQAPVQADREHSYLHLRYISPRRSRDKLKFLAGSESLMGVFINDIVPERIAARLRSVPD